MYADNETTLGIVLPKESVHVHPWVLLHLHALPRNEDPQMVPQDTYYRLTLLGGLPHINAALQVHYSVN